MHLLTYLLTQLAGNISENVEDTAKASINGLYKVVYWLSTAAKMYDLRSRFKVIDSLNAAKMAGKIQLSIMTPTPCRVICLW